MSISLAMTADDAVAFRYAPVPLLLAGAEGDVRVANMAYADLSGKPDVTGHAWPTLLDPSDQPSAWELHHWVTRARDGEPSPRRTLRLARADGSSRPVIVAVQPLPTGDGVVVVLFDIAMDDDMLRVATDLSVESGHLALWSLDLASGQVTETIGSSSFGGLFPGPVRSLDTLLAAVHPDDVARVRRTLGLVAASGDYDQRFRIRDRMGDERWLHVRGRVLNPNAPEATPSRMVGVVSDVTEHARLVERLADRQRRDATQGRRVHQLASDLVSATSVEEIVSLVAQRIATVFDGDGGLFVLVDDGRMRPYGGVGISEEIATLLDGRNMTDGANPVVSVIRNRTRSFWETRGEMLSDFPGAHELLAHDDAASWAIIPLTGSRRTAIGAWILTWKRPHHSSPEERAFMATLAQLTGQALERVRLQQAELQLADALQRRMLPAELPHVPGLEVVARYLPSQRGIDVGGDWYDVIPLPDGRVGLVIGDVEGHSVEAAADMGQVRVVVRAYASSHDDPGAVLAAANRLFHETAETTFATCGYLVLDPATGKAEAAWAGGPPPMYAGRVDSGCWDVPTGPPLGVKLDAEYPVSRWTLPHGTTLLLATDGLVESVQVAMEDGQSAAIGVLTANLDLGVDAAADALVSAAPAGRADDIAFLVARPISLG
ncbi:MAG: SpoIIE family protein phosphatase [Streptosporangiales bacterium]|nr:SpoIIE family protein phosphatase [Streptosporangiales bacterium]